MLTANTSARADTSSYKRQPALKSTFRGLSAITDGMAAYNDPLIDRLMAIMPKGMTKNAWATGAGVNRNIFNDIKKRDNADPDTLAKLLEYIRVNPEAFNAGSEIVLTEVRSADAELLRERPRAFTSRDHVKTMPLVGTAHGGEYGDLEEDIELTELHMGEVVEYLARPMALMRDDKAYALTIVGDSMTPRFKPNERVSVSPQAPVAIGDDVIIQLRGLDGDEERIKMVLIKELVRRTADFVELRQHKPERVFRIERRRVAAMHKVSSNLF